PTVVSQAAQKARNLSVSEGIPTEETVEDILATASSNAESLDAQLDLEDVELDEQGDDAEEPSEQEEEDSGEQGDSGKEN
ncbi:MAG: hypothetical protein ABEJ91_03295, partial [Candidatus Nanohaloarchaea archaeon]